LNLPPEQAAELAQAGVSRKRALVGAIGDRTTGRKGDQIAIGRHI
jgi:hypothetical protein